MGGTRRLAANNTAVVMSHGAPNVVVDAVFGNHPSRTGHVPPRGLCLPSIAFILVFSPVALGN